MSRALIAFGANLGNRQAAIRRMLRMMAEASGIRITACSSLYENPAVGGPPGQGAFLNGALLIETALAPEALLGELQRVESALGRKRSTHWGPRTMDLDILLFERRIIDQPELTVPHPRMPERAFVLIPAAEIAGDMHHPVAGRTVAELAEAVAPADHVHCVAPPPWPPQRN